MLSNTGFVFKFFLQSLGLFYNMSKCIVMFFFMYFKSAAVIFLATLAFMVQFSLPYNRGSGATVWYSIILVFSGLNILFVMPVIFT